MNKIWKFKDKTDAEPERYYGNVRELVKAETIVINGKIKTENGVRYLIRENNRFENHDYLIEQVEVKRSKFKK